MLCITMYEVIQLYQLFGNVYDILNGNEVNTAYFALVM